jgi:PAS domain S-box-containing protein
VTTEIPCRGQTDPETDLRTRLLEAEQTLEAIRSGEVDALLIQTPEGEKVYTLKGAERPYRLLIEEMQEGAATVSVDGTILYCNRRFAEMLGTPLERLMGSRLSCHIAEQDAGRVEDVIGGGGRVECTMTRADGEALPVRLTASPLPHDMPDCVCVIASDITQELRNIELLKVREALWESDKKLRSALQELEGHRDKLEALVQVRTQALRESHERLRHSERMAGLGTLAAGLGHDVSNTILPLRVRLDLLEKGSELSMESREHLDSVRGFADYLASLARGLRQFARDPEQAVGEMRTNLAQWRRDVERFLVASVDQAIEVSIVFEPDLPEVAIAPHRLTQAMLNLIHNGRDAIGAAQGKNGKGHIDIRGATEDGGVAIVVRDNGCGMSEEVRRRCLEPFFTTKARGQGGTGMGLSMVFGMVATAGGHVQVQSTPSEGTAVHVWLPAATARAQPREPGGVSHVTLNDARMQGVVAAVLQSLDREVHSGPPNGDASLWVTDAQSATPEQAKGFLQADPKRRVVVLGGGDEWSRCGASIETVRPPIDRLRSTLARACGR